jgi:glucose/arabinose dehydrogenase
MMVAFATGADAAALPTGFTESLVASDLNNPTAMQFAPDGRLFVCEQGGRLRVIKNGSLLSTPFLTVTVSSSGERGLLGVAFDPDFVVNQFVYVYYTATMPAIHNRVSRFTANGDVAAPGSEVVLLDLENLSATNHNGGALAFGLDDKLYVAVGENAVGSNAQTLGNRLGKILRVNRDGSIPTDNPFFSTATGVNRAIWVLGLRNPFTFAFNGAGTSMFINDVGQNSQEEINEGRAGANYGWPDTEGPTSDPRFDSPRYSYAHAGGTCAIVGGAFYSPMTAQFPAEYLDDYFFADYCAGWIRRLDPASNAVTGLATGIGSPVDLKVATDGSLYYLARMSGGTTGVVYRIAYGATAPTITSQPSSLTVAPGASVTFSVRASGPAPLRYQWQRNGSNIAGATAQDYTIASVAQADTGARFRAIVTNDFGSTTSAEAVLTVSANQAPAATITTPAAGTLYTGGMVISYAGTGSDPEDGTLPASAFTWQVDFHHDTHSHPFMPATTGALNGTFTIPTTGETSANVWYRIYLTVHDSSGATHTVQRDIMPRKVSLTLATTPAGLQLRLDGQPVATPLTFDAVVGIVRSLDAPSPQSSGSASYQFVSWSDGGNASHTISTPGANTTYTATYQASGSPGTGTGLSGSYFDNSNFSGTSVARIDPTIDFIWGSGPPAASIGADTFSVRWTGQIEAPFNGTYTFYTQSDEGIRLWINNVPLVNHWNSRGTEDSATIVLTAGQRYAIRIEYYEKRGNATARLLWSHASIAKTVVPAIRLYPSP